MRRPAEATSNRLGVIISKAQTRKLKKLKEKEINAENKVSRWRRCSKQQPVDPGTGTLRSAKHYIVASIYT
jgi:hypothetical protein